VRAVLNAVPKKSYHGTCLIGGRHEPGSPLARECPLLQRQGRAERRRERAAGVSETVPATTLQGTPEEGGSGPEISGTSTTVFRYGRASKSGRPTTPASEQRQKSRDRIRAWRARQREKASSSSKVTR
jgi:hypothetical protein